MVGRRAVSVVTNAPIDKPKRLGYSLCMNKAAQQLGRLGGSKKSEAKAKASAKNGKKGGRPRLVHMRGNKVWALCEISDELFPKSRVNEPKMTSEWESVTCTRCLEEPVRPREFMSKQWAALNIPKTSKVRRKS